MALKLMYITNDIEIAKTAEKGGVDWIFIDLEINGKVKRQGHLDTVISRHHISDVKKIKSVLKKSKLLVRVNPIFQESKAEIDRVIDNGADIIMLPFFKYKEDVETFIKYVNKRVMTMLLVETPEAVENIDNILNLEGIDYIHIGLNDLHLGYGMDFVFELLANGTIAMLCERFQKKGIPYGFGGIAQLGEGKLPAEFIIAEHYRLGSSMAILSRSFCDMNKIKNIEEAWRIFDTGIIAIREFENNIKNKDKDFFEENRKITIDKINYIKRNKVSPNEKNIINRGI